MKATTPQNKFPVLSRVSLAVLLSLHGTGAEGETVSKHASAAPSSLQPYTASGTKVRITPAALSITEGTEAEIRVSRDDTAGSIEVALALSGDAERHMDFHLNGIAIDDGARVTVRIPDGEASVDLIVEVLDDAHAEADETAVLTLFAVDGDATETGAERATVTIPRNDFIVTSTADNGEGSLRQAIINANTIEGPDTITFDPQAFGEPETIELATQLPELRSELTIDGYIPNRLWRATGVTVSGGYRSRVFAVGERGRATLRSLTIAGGAGDDGAGIINAGTLVLSGVTLIGNAAGQNGGGIANRGGSVTAINSTFTFNAAGDAGGALANLGGSTTITNCTFTYNKAVQGGGVFSRGSLLLRNTILANSRDSADCIAENIDGASSRNLIEANVGCGTPIIEADPDLEPLGYYNGPTKTYPLRAGSPAINLGDNASAVDEHGAPLIWDQRGNGDPRFVAGFTDLGAFEHQRHPYLSVDTLEDTPLRACSKPGVGDCPLRGAIEIANAKQEPTVITFDARVFGEPRTLLLTRPLPEVTSPLTLDASGTAGVTLATDGDMTILTVSPEVALELVDVVVEGSDRSTKAP